MAKQIAFVAMKFDNVSWKDSRYNIIKEVLEEAGFSVIRTDEINTSEPFEFAILSFELRISNLSKPNKIQYQFYTDKRSIKNINPEKYFLKK